MDKTSFRVLLGFALLVLASFNLLAHFYALAAKNATHAAPDDALLSANQVSAITFLPPLASVSLDKKVRELYKRGNNIPAAAKKSQGIIENSPIDVYEWFSYLELRLISPVNSYDPIKTAEIIKHLDRTASSEPGLRMALAKLGLRHWYTLQPPEQIAFRLHFDWLIKHFPNPLWGNAYALGRERLLCRLYSYNYQVIPLCRNVR